MSLIILLSTIIVRIKYVVMEGSGQSGTLMTKHKSCTLTNSFNISCSYSKQCSCSHHKVGKAATVSSKTVYIFQRRG